MGRGRRKRTPVAHTLMVVDRSGSMQPLERDVRGGFNSFLADLRRDAEAGGVEFRVTAVLFDDRYEPLATAASLDEVPELTEANYSARGMTALLDAIGRTLNDFEASTTLRTGDTVTLVVQTDGAENQSREFTSGQIAEMLRDREKRGWRTVYLGAGPAAWGQGRSLGFGINVNTTADSATTTRSYGVAAAAAVGVARGASYAETRRVYESLDVAANGDGDQGGAGAAPAAASRGATRSAS